jgi:hypothetical protein
MTGTVHIVHCIDTEGPLYESLRAKFERLKDLFGIEHVAPTPANFRALQRGDIPLGGREKDVARALAGHLSGTLGTWTEIDAMLERVMSPEYRSRQPDSFGRDWIYNWFCLDHVNFAYNPRRRDIGFHNVFDHYREIVDSAPNSNDSIQWHFHPMSTYRDAHRCATHYFRSSEIFEILSRKIIERSFFPSVFRAGFQTERPDSHWFLEQWIPFDISNMALDDNTELEATIDFKNGRSGDWRRAPADWSVYHPSHDDYQLPGGCRRVIGRCLNVLNRLASIDQREMDKAFARAREGKPTLVGMNSHDWRDLGAEVDHIRSLLDESRRRFPEVHIRYCRADDAFRRVLWPVCVDESGLDLELLFHPAGGGDVASIEVRTKAGKVFGPQPFLAIETKSRRFIHDNFDFSMTGDRWHYAFHADTLPVEDVRRIGIAANDHFGNTCIRHLALGND